MASLREVVIDKYMEIAEGLAWVVIYRKGRSWQSSSFFAKSGSYDEGLVFSEEDVCAMKTIARCDPKAVCVNGCYMGFRERYTKGAIVDKVLWMYQFRLNQLDGDFLGSLVCES